MLQAANIVSSNISGQTDGICIPCFRNCRGIVLSGQSSHRKYLTLAHVRIRSKQRAAICRASYNDHRRNPDFNHQNRQGFSESNIWKNEESDRSDNLEPPGLSSVTDGLMNSLAGTPRFKVSETPGPREKEIVELFRKIQAQLRERSTLKEQKKYQSIQEKFQEKGSIDSLLKLLRKHSSEKSVRKLNGNANSEFDTGNYSVQNGAPNGFRETGFTNASNHAAYESKEPIASTRPASSFRRSSPISQTKNLPPPAYRRRSTADYKPYIRNKSVSIPPEPAIEPKTELAVDTQFNHEQESIPDLSNIKAEISDDKPSSFHIDVDTEEASEEEEVLQTTDFSTLKLADLRSIAKSHGLKGFSKLKKTELVELLNKSSL